MDLRNSVFSTLDLVASAGGFIFDNHREFWFRVIGSALAVAATSAAIVTVLDTAIFVSTAATLPILAFQVYFALHWLLVILYQRRHSRLPITIGGKKRLRPYVTTFIGYSLLLAFAFTIFVGPLGIVMLAALSGISGVSIEPMLQIFTPDTFTLRCVAIGPFFIAAFCRLFLVFPALAGGEELGLRESWLLARGIGWPLFGSQLLCAVIGLTLFSAALTLPWTLLEAFSSERLLAVGLSSFAVTVASGIHIALATFCLAELYAVCRIRRRAGS